MNLNLFWGVYLNTFGVLFLLSIDRQMVVKQDWFKDCLNDLLKNIALIVSDWKQLQFDFLEYEEFDFE
jgi:hypothetical protein